MILELNQSILFSSLTRQQVAVVNVLGSDWFLLFLQPHLHPSTVKLALILLTHFLWSPSQQSSFREGVIPAKLIEGTEEPLAVIGTDLFHFIYAFMTVMLIDNIMKQYNLSNSILISYCFITENMHFRKDLGISWYLNVW